MSKTDPKYSYDDYIKDLFIKNKFSCEVDKNPIGCRILGDYYYDTNYFDKAAATYKVACETYRDDVSCYKYGVQQAQGKGTSINYPEAIKNMEFACKKGVAPSCYALACLKLSEEGKEAGLHNMPEGLYYNTVACDLGYSTGCVEAGRLHLSGYLHCPELVKDSEKALTMLRKACSGGVFAACEVVGQMFLKGEGCEKDEDMAKKYFEAAEQGKRSR